MDIREAVIYGSLQKICLFKIGEEGDKWSIRYNEISKKYKEIRDSLIFTKNINSLGDYYDAEGNLITYDNSFVKGSIPMTDAWGRI